MKKLLVSILLVFIATSAFARFVEIGKYTSYMKEYAVNADLEKYSIRFDVYGSRGSRVLIVLKDAGAIDNFREGLIQVRDKYAEWQRVAIENNVTELTKKIPVAFRPVEMAWDGVDWYFDFSVPTSFEFGVKVLDNGDLLISARCLFMGVASSNEYIKKTSVLSFRNVEEIQSLIDLLDLSKIIDKQEKNAATEALFN